MVLTLLIEVVEVGLRMHINLDYLTEYLISSISGYILEFSAIISGFFYLKNNPNTHLANKHLVYFLCYTLLTDIIGGYSPLAYFTKFEYFGFIKDTIIEYNYWWFNIYMIISFSFFIYYFNSFLISYKSKKWMQYLIVLYLITGIINLIFSDVFFNGYSIFTTVVGTLIVLVSIFLFYFDLLKSEKIIDLKKHLPVYISIGVLVYNLCVTPSDIFSQYFNPNNDIYVKLSGLILLTANIFMYSTFIIGFLVCAKKEEATVA